MIRQCENLALLDVTAWIQRPPKPQGGFVMHARCIVCARCGYIILWRCDVQIVV
jgi:hypothetical protein